MYKKLLLITFSFMLLFGVNAQTNPFVGTWTGDIVEPGDEATSDKLIWKIKLKVYSANSAELLIYDFSKAAFVPYLTDLRFSEQKKKVTFASNNNTAFLSLSYWDANQEGQSVYNLMYSKTEGKVWAFWSNIVQPEASNSSYIGLGWLDPESTKKYSGSNLQIGGSSFSYIKINEVQLSDKTTSVQFKITNNTTEKLTGTFHEPGSETAFYITDANRSKKYKLRSASVSLPFEFSLNPGKELSITLNFEAIPASMKLLNVFEGGDNENNNLWKFYDVKLKD